MKRFTRELLRNYADDESVDECVNRLLDELGGRLADESLFHVGHTTIDLDVDTVARLDGCRLYENEPYDSVLFRAISLYNSGG